MKEMATVISIHYLNIGAGNACTLHIRTISVPEDFFSDIFLSFSGSLGAALPPGAE